MAVDGSLNFDTSIDTSGFSKGTKSISSSLGGLKSALGKVAVAVAAAFSVKQIIDFGKQAIETASDMAEVQNVVDTAFGSMSYKMEEFANNSIKQFGISKLAAKQTGSTFMAMASDMGLAVDNASDMAIALTGLSADMASFYNVSQEVASTALKSIFTGETETLKQFGIVMTDANLQAYALSQGINKSTQNMSQAEKVQLRYNYVMQQTALAQGDFAKTQDSWANQTRILTEQWKEFGATVGNLLMSVFLPAIKTLNNVLSQLISYADSAVKALANVFGIKLNNNSSGAGQLANDTSQLADDSSQAADNYSDMAESAEEAQKADEKSLASFDKINKLSDNTSKKTKSKVSTPATNTGNSLAGKTGTVKVKADVEISEAQKKIQKFLESVKKALSRLFEPIQKAWDKYGAQVIRTMKTAFGEIWDLIKSIGKSFMNVWTNGSGERLVGNILKIFQDIFSIIGSIAKAFKDAWNDNHTGEKYVQSIFDKFNAVLELIHEIANSFKTVFSNGTGKEIIQNILEIFTHINNTIRNIADNLKKAWTKDNLGTKLVQGLADILNIVLGHVNNITKGFEEWSANLDFTPILEGLNSLVDALKPFADAIGKGLETFFKEVLQPMAKWTIEDAIPTFLETLSDVISGISSVLNTAMPVIKDKLWDGFLKPVASWAADTALKALKSLGSLIKKLCESVTETDVKVLIDLAGAVAGIYAAVKLKSALDSLPLKINAVKESAKLAGDKIGGLVTNLKNLGKTDATAPKIPDVSADAATKGSAAGVSFGAKFCAVVGAAIAGWQIGKMIRDAIGGDTIDESLFPIFDSIVNTIKSAWNKIKEIFNTWITGIVAIKDAFLEFCDNWKTGIKSIKNVFVGFRDLWKAGVQAISDKLNSAWSSIKSVFATWKIGINSIKNIFVVFRDIWKSGMQIISDKVSSAWNSIKSIFETWKSGIGAIKDKFASFRDTWKLGMQAISDKLRSVWNSIKGVFDVWKTGIGAIKDKFASFRDTWKVGVESIGKKLKSVWDGTIKSRIDGWKAGIDSIKNGFNNFKDAWATGLDEILNKIKAVWKKIKGILDAWKTGFESIKSGATEFGDNWKTGWDSIFGSNSKKTKAVQTNASIPEIPKLARGSVIPPNKEFLAVLGDQKKGTNVEAPLDTIKQAVLQALVMYGEAGNTGGNGSLTVNLNLDGKTISTKVIDNINDFIKRNGKSPIIA